MVYFICFFAAVFWIVTAHAGQGFNQTRELSEIKNNISSHTVVESATATPSLLRILPLGASITWGYLSSDNNGYRETLRDRLTASYDVDMVGTKHNGNMVDNDLEAHIGDVITQVQAAAQASLQYSPNVVLINAGTNDCLQSLDIENAGARMQSLVNMLLDNINGTTVVLSTLIPCKDATAEANRPSVNSQYRALVTSLQSQGKKAVLADMDPSSNPEYWNESTDFADDVHPNDGGYKKMADVWFDTIERAITDRKIAISAKPLVSEGSGGYSKTCKQGAFAVAFLLCVGDFI